MLVQNYELISVPFILTKEIQKQPPPPPTPNEKKSADRFIKFNFLSHLSIKLLLLSLLLQKKKKVKS